MSYGPVRKAFQDAGVELQIHDNNLTKIAVCDVAEDDPQWETVRHLLKKYETMDIPFTKFSDSELSNAKHLAMGSSWHHGYPQPEDDFGYMQLTYDLRDYCEHCGIGAKQISPFRMKKSPNWGRRSILQMNWLFDEYFVKPEVWNAVFQPLGINCRVSCFTELDRSLNRSCNWIFPSLCLCRWIQTPLSMKGVCSVTEKSTSM